MNNRKKYFKKYYAKHKGKIRAEKRAKRIISPKEPPKRKTERRKGVRRSKEEIAAYQKQYYQDNKEKAKAYQKQYNLDHKKPTEWQGIPKETYSRSEVQHMPVEKMIRLAEQNKLILAGTT